MVSITKFSIVIFSPRAYLSLIGGRSSGRPFSIWTFWNWIPVVEYPRDSPVNYVRFHAFLHNFSYSFQNFWKVLQTFFAQGKISQNIFNSEICHRFWNSSHDYSLNRSSSVQSLLRASIRANFGAKWRLFFKGAVSRGFCSFRSILR